MLSLIYNKLPSLPQTFQRLKSILYISQMDTDTNSSNSLKSKWYQPLILKAKDYEFNEPVSKSDKEFWQGVGAKIYVLALFSAIGKSKFPIITLSACYYY